MYRYLKIATLLSGAMTAVASQAGVYLVTYTGTGTVSDSAGLFGQAHADYEASSYNIVFRADDTLGSIYDSGYGERLTGYVSASNPSAVTATISINGSRPYAFLGTAYGYAQQRLFEYGSSTPAPEIQDVVQDQQNIDSTFGTSAQVYAYVGNHSGTESFLSGRDFRIPLVHLTQDGDYTNAGFNIYGAGGRAAGPEAVGYFNVSSVTVAAASVPEPASWLMLISGFAFVGFAHRRRSGKQVFAA